MKHLSILLLFLIPLSSFGQYSFDLESKAKKGDIVAQYDLGNAFFNGWGIAKNYERAVYRFKKAAANGNTDAETALGNCYFNGNGVEKDIPMSIRLYTKAGNNGNEFAQFILATMYYKGEYVAKDSVKAFSYLQKSANTGLPDAMVSMGNCYYFGEGTDQNYTTALKWYEAAAAKEAPYGYFNAALLYEQGLGTSVNIDKAIAYYKKASDMGNENATLNYNRLMSKQKEESFDFSNALNALYNQDYNGLEAMFNRLGFKTMFVPYSADHPDQRGTYYYKDCLVSQTGDIQNAKESSIVFNIAQSDRNSFICAILCHSARKYLDYSDAADQFEQEHNGRVKVKDLPNKDQLLGLSVSYGSYDIAVPAPSASGNIPKDKVFDVVEYMPSFPGGNGALMEYLAKNIKYPSTCETVEGRILVSFIVEKDGSLSNLQIQRSVDPVLDAEALRVVRTMPRWNPGKQYGTAVRVRYSLPVTFRFQ